MRLCVLAITLAACGSKPDSSRASSAPSPDARPTVAPVAATTSPPAPTPTTTPPPAAAKPSETPPPAGRPAPPQAAEPIRHDLAPGKNADLDKCYDLLRDSSITSFSLSLRPDGTVTAIDLPSSAPDDARTCLDRAIRSLHLHPPSGLFNVSVSIDLSH